MIVGIDEVGRGPWAGPLVFGAVVLGENTIEGLTDSKKLSKKRRETLDREIRAQAKAYGLGWVHADELDELGLSEALKLACRRALEAIKVPYQQIIIDGTVNFLSDTGKGPYVTTLKQADLLVPSVSAASIIAKVARDAFMSEQDIKYPGYGFSAHVGYGTTAHSKAIEQYGVTELHRKSFAPIRKLLSKEEATLKKAITHNTTSIGQKAEAVASEYLTSKGYRVLERNWRTKACEIDIIAQKEETIHFVEVKYRRSSTQGGGIAAITASKLKQMKFAATLWMQKYGECAAKLSVIEVFGDQFEVTRFIADV